MGLVQVQPARALGGAVPGPDHRGDGRLPGGNYFSRLASHYSLTLNFFSDLGATRTYAHQANAASSILFILALVFVGISMIVFSFNTLLIWKKKDRFMLPGKVAVLLAIVSGISFIGIAAAPSNLTVVAHKMFVFFAFGSLLGYVILITLMQFGNGWAKPYIVSNLVYAGLLVAYICILSSGPAFRSLDGLQLGAVSQKVIVYVSILNMAIQAIGIKRHSRSLARTAAAAVPA